MTVTLTDEGIIFEKDCSHMVKQTLCKGKVFRASRNYFYQKGRLVNSVELRLLKRKSCPGCPKCGWVEEYLQEEVNCKYPILGLEEVRPGRLYTIHMCNISTDWETGHVDDFNLKVVEASENKDEENNDKK